MKTRFFISIFLIISCNLSSNEISEDFLSFLIKFSFDENFQKERIEFPLSKFVESQNSTAYITKMIDEKEWEHITLIEGSQNYVTDIMYNFGSDDVESDERVFKFIGIETGIDLKYFFKRIDGNWYLIKITDFST